MANEDEPSGDGGRSLDERVKLPLPFEDAMRALLDVKPDEDERAKPNKAANGNRATERTKRPQAGTG